MRPTADKRKDESSADDEISENDAKITAAVVLVSALAIALSLTAGCSTVHEARRADRDHGADLTASPAAAATDVGDWVADDDILGAAAARNRENTGATAERPVIQGYAGGVTESPLPPQRHERPLDSLHSEWAPAPAATEADHAGFYPLPNGTFAAAPIENRDPGIGGEAARRNHNPLAAAIAAREAVAGTPPGTDAAPLKADLLRLPNGSAADATAGDAASLSDGSATAAASAEPEGDATAASEPTEPAAAAKPWSVSYEPRGIVIAVEDGLFAVGQASPAPRGGATMDEIAAFLARYPGRAIIVESHTDSTGPAPANMQLSRKRAEVVRAGLIARGIAPQDVEARGYGESYPTASNASEQGRLRNDRIELVLVPPGQSGEASYRESLEASAGDLTPY